MTERTRTGTLSCLLTILVALALSGCATTKRDWQEANRLGTVDAYELFLQNHPNAEQASDARRLLPKLRAEEDWSKAEAANTLGAYEKFLSKYPQSEHAKQANEVMESLRFEHARANESIDAYESYLSHHPDGSAAQEAQSRLRELRYADARQRGTVAAFESFLARYSEGADVDTLRAKLPAVQALEKSLALGRAIMKHAPQTSMTISNFSVTGKTTERSDPTATDLSRLRSMLSEGVDPNAVRVAGFEPAGEKQLGGGAVLHSTGKPGRIVRAEEGGMTLLEYCRVNDLESIAALLIEHGAK